MWTRVGCVWTLVVFFATLVSCGAMESGDGDDGNAPPLSLELLAGDIGGFGSVDGAGREARFWSPHGVTVDAAGNLYISDQNNQTIRRITAAGAVTTLAGTPHRSGSADGTGAEARFSSPDGLVVDSGGNLYVADQLNHTIRKVTAGGVVTTVAGLAGVPGSTDGAGALARFNTPTGLALDTAGNLYIADRENHTIRRMTAAGVVSTLAGVASMEGSADGPAAKAHFFSPSGVAVDGTGNVYVGELNNAAVRKISASGMVTTLAGDAEQPGSVDGVGDVARFSSVLGLAVDAAGNVIVTDEGNDTIRKISPAGIVTTLAGMPGMWDSSDGVGAAARFGGPAGLAIAPNGSVYVADRANHTIRQVTAAGVVTTLAGTASKRGAANGTGADARFSDPTFIASDAEGNVYVADTTGYTIRKVTMNGIVTTLAGGTFGTEDGTGAEASFWGPSGVAVDATGNVYVTDAHAIRKVTAAGAVTTLAGGARVGGSGDGAGTQATFNSPLGVAVDLAGDLHIADSGNPTIRKISSAGVVTTVAGAAKVPGTADGSGADARFNFPLGLAASGGGNVFVTDLNATIRKVSPAGAVTTLAGTADRQGSADGTGPEARFDLPAGVAVDSAGNLYVADLYNATIRRITPAGITTTIAGTAGSAGIVLGESPRFSAPTGVAIVGDSLVISDNNAILLLRHAVQ